MTLLHPFRFASIALTCVLLAGCSTFKPTQKAFAPDEYDLRHPIRLAENVRHLDVFTNGPKLDRRQHQDVIGFAREYASQGRGGITIAVPQGSGHHDLAAIRQALSAGGASGHMQVTPYSADHTMGAAPVRLSFRKLEARVSSQCGQWPADLAGAKDLETWQNRPYHNLGCSYQSMIAAQVADPLDLVRPRLEGPIDVAKRTKDIEALRKSEDPSTKWAKDDAKIEDGAKK